MSAFSGLTLNPVYSTAGELAVVRAAADTGNVIIGLAKFALSGVILCVIGGASDIMGRRMRVTGAVAAIGLLGMPPTRHRVSCCRGSAIGDHGCLVEGGDDDPNTVIARDEHQKLTPAKRIGVYRYGVRALVCFGRHQRTSR